MQNLELVRAKTAGDATLSSLDVIFIQIDSDNEIVQVSDGFCEAVKRTRKVLVGSKLGVYIPEGVPHIHNEPIDWLADKFHSDEAPRLTSVPFIRGDTEIVKLDLGLCLITWPGQQRPEFGAFGSVAK